MLPPFPNNVVAAISKRQFSLLGGAQIGSNLLFFQYRPAPQEGVAVGQ
jgi:hypothetical protein